MTCEPSGMSLLGGCTPLYASDAPADRGEPSERPTARAAAPGRHPLGNAPDAAVSADGILTRRHHNADARGERTHPDVATLSSRWKRSGLTRKVRQPLK